MKKKLLLSFSLITLCFQIKGFDINNIITGLGNLISAVGPVETQVQTIKDDINKLRLFIACKRAPKTAIAGTSTVFAKTLQPVGATKAGAEVIISKRTAESKPDTYQIIKERGELQCTDIKAPINLIKNIIELLKTNVIGSDKNQTGFVGNVLYILDNANLSLGNDVKNIVQEIDKILTVITQVLSFLEKNLVVVKAQVI